MDAISIRTEATGHRRPRCARGLMLGGLVVALLVSPIATLRPVACAQAPRSAESPAAAPVPPKDAVAGDKAKAGVEEGDDDPAVPHLSAAGRVVDATGQPIAGAVVSLREWSALGAGERSDDAWDDVLARTTTDANGTFEFRRIAGRPIPFRFRQQTPWDLVVTAPGCGLAAQHLRAEEDTAPHLFSLSPEATLRGKLVDPQGQPVAGAEIDVEEFAALDADPDAGPDDGKSIKLDRGRLTPRGCSDARGNFAIAGLPAESRLRLAIRHPDFLDVEEFAATTNRALPELQITDIDAESRTRPFTPAKKRVEVRQGAFVVRLQPGHRLSGSVVEAETGFPLRGARVRLSYGRRSRSVTADAEGRFTFTGLSDISGSLDVSAPGEERLRREIACGFAGEMQKSMRIELPLGIVVAGTIVAADSGAGAAGVTVRDEPVEGANPKDRLYSAAGQSDAEGRFRLRVPSGQRVIRISGPLRGFVLPAVVLTTTPRRMPFTLRPADAPFVRIIDTSDGKPVDGLRFDVGRGLVVRGIVVDPEGRPVAEADVAYPGGSSREITDRQTKTDAQGRFELSALPFPGDRALMVVAKARRLATHVAIPPPAANESPLNRTAEIEVKLQPAGRVTGIVTDGTNPLPGVAIQYAYSSTGFSVRTDAEGRFAIDAFQPEWPSRIHTTADGFASAEGPMFEVRPGQQFEHPAFVLKRADRTISGIVVDSAGKPVTNVNVELRDRVTNRLVANGRGTIYAITDREGRFTLNNVPGMAMRISVGVNGPTLHDIDVDGDKSDLKVVVPRN